MAFKTAILSDESKPGIFFTFKNIQNLLSPDLQRSKITKIPVAFCTERLIISLKLRMCLYCHLIT